METFKRLHDRREVALVAFTTCGDPSPEASLEVVKALIRGGADIIELGVPFSDPIADGPVIQASSLRALNAGTTPAKVLEVVRAIRCESDLPIVLLTYYNLVFRMGLEFFGEAASEAGVDGLVVPDLPVEEANDYLRNMRNHGLDTIFLAAPSTSIHRLEGILSATSGFLYLVSLYGVTGTRETLDKATTELVRRLSAHLAGRLPLAVGFGISKPEHVESLVTAGADGVIVGSVFVKTVQQHQHDLAKALRQVEVQASMLKAGTIKLG
jgi:tryptophan synthase alpha chain